MIYAVDGTGVHTIWQTRMLRGLQAVARGDLMTVRYADAARFYRVPQLPKPWILEVYQISGEAPRLLVLQHY